MDCDVLLFANSRQRNTNGITGGVYATHQSTGTVLLPLFALATLLIRDVRLLHGDERRGHDGISIVGKFAAHQDAVTRLDVRQLNRRGIFQVFLTGGNSSEFGGVLDLNGHVAARIWSQSNNIP